MGADPDVFNGDDLRRTLPDAVFGPPIALRRRPRLVLAGHGADVRRCFSGSSFYLTEAGIAEKLIEGCFTLYSKSADDYLLAARGLVWKLAKRTRGMRAGGYKFAPGFQNAVWKKHIGSFPDIDIISNFQIVAPDVFRSAARANVGLTFYVDGTLHDYFESYRGFDVVADIDPTTMAEAMAIEKDGYQSAQRVVTMSRRATATLIDRYQIPAERVSTVPPGANLPVDLPVEDFTRLHRRAGDDFVLGFVGLYPERKGLDRLARATRILRQRGVRVRLRVIGRAPPEIQRMDGVEFLGSIDKVKQPERFLEALRPVDLGCQMSRAELTGIALCEYLRLGIPILGTDVGGATDILSPGGSIMVPVDIDDGGLADVLQRTIANPDRYARLKTEALGRREWAGWARAARHLDAAFTG